MAIGHPRGSNGFRGKAKKAKQAIQRRGLRRRDILEESEAEDDSDAEDLGSKIIVSDDAKKAKRFLQVNQYSRSHFLTYLTIAVECL